MKKLKCCVLYIIDAVYFCVVLGHMILGMVALLLNKKPVCKYIYMQQALLTNVLNEGKYRILMVTLILMLNTDTRKVVCYMSRLTVAMATPARHIKRVFTPRSLQVSPDKCKGSVLRQQPDLIYISARA